MAQGAAAEPYAAPVRLRSLDGVRGLAACIVAFGFHAQFMFHQGSFPAGWGGPAIAWLHERGWTAVDLFFVLSGYIFAHVYLSGRALSSPAGLADFAIARIARLYPLHLLMLICAAWLFSWLSANTPAAFIAHLAMMQALAPPVGHTFVGPSWSISVEMLCYLLFAAAAFWRPRALPAIAVGVVIVSAAVLIVHPANHNLDIVAALSRGFLGFFTGLLLWHGRDWLRRIPTVLLVAAAIIGVVGDARGVASVLPLTLLSWPAVVLIALRSPALGAGWLLWLGDRSYAIYLSHMLFIDFLFLRMGGLAPTFANLVIGHAFLILLVLGVSDLIYRRFELPMRHAIRDRWTMRRRVLAGAG